MLERRVEEAALNAWPPLQQMLYDGWVLRFAAGYTKRANSVTPLYESRLDLRAKVAACERIYAQRALPCSFRLTPFAPPELEPLLDQREYALVEPSGVMHLELGSGPARSAAAELHEQPLHRWLPIYAALSGLPAGRQPILQAMLAAIPARMLLVSLREAGTPVGCALGVLEGELFGIFDLVVAPDRRRRGYGTRVVRGLLDRARAAGALGAYLQVVDTNAPARRLYETLGFQDLYPYRYRVLKTR